MKKITQIASLATILFTTAFAGNVLAKNKVVNVGVISGNETQVAEVVAKVAKAKYGLKVNLVKFDNYVLPNNALFNKKIDVNAFQHVPYLNEEIQNRGYNTLRVVGYTFVFPIAGYSKKHKDINKLPRGAKILLPNDPTNLGRGLLLLQSYGLIKLKSDTKLTQDLRDIVSNPKKFKFTTLDANLLVRTLPSADLAIINGTFASPAGLTPNKDGILVERSDSPYVNIIVARKDNELDQDVIDLVKAWNSEEVYQAGLKIFGPSIVKGWSNK